MSGQGFSLVELLIATALLLVITGALVAAVVPVRHVVARADARDAMVAGGRGALELLHAAVHEAGSGDAIGGRAFFAAMVPPVVILRDLDATEEVEAGAALRLSRVPAGAAQAIVRDPIAAGHAHLRIDAAGPCPGLFGVCGFTPGLRAVVYDDTGIAAFTVTAVRADGTLHVSPPIDATFAPGAIAAAVSTVTFGLRPAGEAFDLVRLSDAGALQPVVSNVVEFSVRRRGRLIELTLRVQAAEASLRGPRGTLFRQAGLATTAWRWVPDLHWTTRVAVRSRP